MRDICDILGHTIELVRGKTSITLPDDLLAAIDRTGADRSQFVESAARRYLAETAKAHGNATDAAILEEVADHLNQEAVDVLEYQSLPE